MDMSELNFETVTAADLDNLSMDDLLGNAISDIDLSSSLPDGSFIGYIEKMEIKSREAKPEEGKKGNVALQMNLKVSKCLQCADSNVDAASLTGRVHVQRFWLHVDMGKQQIAKLILGIMGISYRDKAAIAQVGGNVSELLNQLQSEKVAFGFQVKNTENNGFESCDMIFKEQAFIPMESAVEYLD